MSNDLFASFLKTVPTDQASLEAAQVPIVTGPRILAYIDGTFTSYQFGKTNTITVGTSPDCGIHIPDTVRKSYDSLNYGLCGTFYLHTLLSPDGTRIPKIVYHAENTSTSSLVGSGNFYRHTGTIEEAVEPPEADPEESEEGLPKAADPPSSQNTIQARAALAANVPNYTGATDYELVANSPVCLYNGGCIANKSNDRSTASITFTADTTSTAAEHTAFQNQCAIHVLNKFHSSQTPIINSFLKLGRTVELTRAAIEANPDTPYYKEGYYSARNTAKNFRDFTIAEIRDLQTTWDAWRVGEDGINGPPCTGTLCNHENNGRNNLYEIRVDTDSTSPSPLGPFLLRPYRSQDFIWDKDETNASGKLHEGTRIEFVPTGPIPRTDNNNTAGGASPTKSRGRGPKASPKRQKQNPAIEYHGVFAVRVPFE